MNNERLNIDESIFINIHTHSLNSHSDELQIYNLFIDANLKESEFPQFVSLSIHPWYFQDFPETEISILKKLALNPSVIAIGEFGFDKLKGADFEIQKKVFAELADIAENSAKPAIIHCVRSTEEILQIRSRKNYCMPWIFHRFSGNQYEATQLTGEGIFLSFGESLIKSEKLQQVFKKLPLEVVFFETDNASVSIKDIYEFAAGLKGISVDELKNMIMLNFNELFKWRIQKRNTGFPEQNC